jgi:hypothetical protein
MEFYDNVWPVPQKFDTGALFTQPESFSIAGDTAEIIEAELSGSQLGKLIAYDCDYKIMFKLIDDLQLPDEGYRLKTGKDGIEIFARQPNGLFYGMQTILQLFESWRKMNSWQELSIEDFPAYHKRSFMADMGRSVFPLPMLKRIVRILGRLKMNQLHLHLFDDELCGIRFDGHAFGSDNPYALSMRELKELIDYAQQYYVEVIPEIESWAHAGSITYFRPELQGGEGVFNGSSFLISEDVFDLVRDLTSQIAEVMPQNGVFHFGLDEANWFVAESMPEDYSPEQMFIRYYDMLQDINRQFNKNFTMRMWHDHKGRRIPSEIRERIIVEPWGYWNLQTEDIDNKIAYFSQSGMRWMIGAGQSMGQYRGAYHATRHWCRNALDKPGVEGVNITFWGRNDLDNHLISLFAGAYYAWNPCAQTEFSELEDYEAFDRIVFPIMRNWQTACRDAFPDDLCADRGPCVYNGFYWGGAKHGMAVSPSVIQAKTSRQHNFINEANE